MPLSNPLPTLQPLSAEGAVVLSAFLISLTVALVALIANRRRIIGDIESAEGDLGAILEQPSALIPHLTELRDRAVRSLVAIVLASVCAAALTEPVLNVISAPIGGLQALTIIRVTEGVGVFFRVALTMGVILASPYVLAQIWIFVAAGLKRSERKLFYWLFPFALILFVAGVSFSYFVMLPVAVPFLVNFLGLTARPTLDDYFQFITTVMLWVGLSFEMPLIVFILARLRIVNAALLLRNWRIAVVLIAILAAVITPTPDPVNMGIVAAPLLVLYMLSIILAKFANP